MVSRRESKILKLLQAGDRVTRRCFEADMLDADVHGPPSQVIFAVTLPALVMVELGPSAPISLF